jgi:hypothetical protein
MVRILLKGMRVMYSNQTGTDAACRIHRADKKYV